MINRAFPLEPVRMNAELFVINLFGAPGIGKSCVAGGLYWEMGSDHISVQNCREYAKYLTLTDRGWQLREEQLYVLAMQHHELFILRGKYKYAITDSPLPLTAFYAPRDVTPQVHFDAVMAYHELYTNINFFLVKDLDAPAAPFQTEGRWHTEDECMDLQVRQMAFLDQLGIDYEIVKVNKHTPQVLRQKIAEWEFRRPNSDRMLTAVA
jgi:hypothetical protein